jgi:hypothetical protein
MNKSTAQNKKIFVAAVNNWVAENAAGVLSEDEIIALIATLLENKASLLKILVQANSPQEKMIAVKDPNHPKHGKSSYIFFCLAERPKIVKATPEMDAKEITKLLGANWRKLSDKQKSKYKKLAETDRSRYLKDMETYKPPIGLGFVPARKGKKVRVGPKRGLSSYIIFCQKRRAGLKDENPDLPTKDVTAALGAEWRGMDDDAKAPFVSLSAIDKERYETERAAFDANVSSTDPDDVETVSKPSSKKPAASKKKASKKASKKKASKKKPSKKEASKKEASKKKASSKKDRSSKGYKTFSVEFDEQYLEDNPDASKTKMSKDRNSFWDGLEDVDRECYNDSE